MAMQSTVVSTRMAGPHWRILRFAAGFLKIIAILLALLGIGSAVVVILTAAGVLSSPNLFLFPIPVTGGNLIIGISVAVGILFGTLINFLFFYAASELMLVLIAIEKNTRSRTF